jgi:hypothetical protein
MRPFGILAPNAARGELMLGRCRCKQLLTGLGRQLEMVYLLRLGSCKGLKPTRVNNPLGKTGLSRLISCTKVLAGWENSVRVA